MKYQKRKKRTKQPKQDVNVYVGITDPKAEPQRTKDPMKKWTIILWVVDFLAIVSVIRAFTDDLSRKDVGGVVFFIVVALAFNGLYRFMNRDKADPESCESMVTVDHYCVSVGFVVYAEDPYREVCEYKVRAISGEITGFERDGKGELIAEVTSHDANGRRTVRFFHDFELYADALNVGKGNC